MWRRVKWENEMKKRQSEVQFSRIPLKNVLYPFFNGLFAFLNSKEAESRAKCSELILTTWNEKCRLEKEIRKKYFSFYNHSSSTGKVKRKKSFLCRYHFKIPLFNLTMKKSTAPAKRKQEKTFSVLLEKPLHFIAITFYGHRCFVLISDRKVTTDALSFKIAQSDIKIMSLTQSTSDSCSPNKSRN